MQKWEYKIILGYSDESELNGLGEQGWELVAIVVGGAEETPHGKEIFGAWGPKGVHVYLKRPKQ